jgi:hypothetical protein
MTGTQTVVQLLEQSIHGKDLKHLRRLVMQQSTADETAIVAVILLELLGTITPKDQMVPVFEWLFKIRRGPPKPEPKSKLWVGYHDE